ncbi:MAG: TetR family transcriptional regulator [Calditrichaeota bacterium]|nr:TetR family transcriptional regulator [Calditrichota bacterium]
MPKVVDKEAKKNEIVNAAMKVFAQKGFANTKMSDIAKAAKIGKGTIYEYFKDKSDIFEHGFVSLTEQWETTVAKKIFKITDPEEKLKAIFYSFLDFFEGEHSEIIDVMLDFWAEAIRQKDEQRLRVINLEKIYQDFRQIIIAVLQEGIRIGKFKPMNTFMVASLLIGMTDGLMLQWIMDKDLIDIKEGYRCLAEEILSGIYAI